MAGNDRRVTLDCGSSRCIFARASGRSMAGRRGGDDCGCLWQHRTMRAGAGESGWCYPEEVVDEIERLMLGLLGHVDEFRRGVGVPPSRPSSVEKMAGGPDSIFAYDRTAVTDVVLQSPTEQRRGWDVVVTLENTEGAVFATALRIMLGVRPGELGRVAAGWGAAIKKGPEV